MRRELTLFLATLLAGGVLSGCRHDDSPPPRVPVPAADNPDRVRGHDYPKPMPGDRRYDTAPYQPRYDDPPLIDEQLPEMGAYLDAYDRIGRPRITVFVNRTFEGEIVPVNDPVPPDARVEVIRRSSAGVDIETRETRSGRRSDEERVDRFQSEGPAEYRESVDVYLRPGEYDEYEARAIDYGAIENVLSDWLAADGEVEVVAPTLARQRLTDEQVKELQEGRPQALGEIARQLDADVLVQVQARPTRHTEDERLAVRLIAEAMNTDGGQSIGRYVVDVPPPLSKQQINRYTRFLARELMNDMTGAWSSAAAARPATRPVDNDRND